MKTKYLFDCIEFLPNIIVRGSGSYVYDVSGNKLLDLNAGQFCSVFGHSWPNLERVMSRQLKKVCHTSTRIITPEILTAAKDVYDICEGMTAKTLFLSTGSEAVECAIRYAKHIKNKDGLVCFKTGYHGLSLGSQSVTFGGEWALPKVNHIHSINAPIFHEISSRETRLVIKKSLNELEIILQKNIDHIAGFIMEPIISVGGMNFLPKDYCEGIYKLCKKYDVLLILDECQTGVGRTGKWFGYQHFQIKPDILVSAKAIGAGFPVSMVVFNSSTINLEGTIINHYSSHQNDPISAVIVSEVIKEIENKNLLLKITEKGSYFLTLLSDLCSKYDFIRYPRGKGLMLGFDIYKDGIISYRDIGNRFTQLMLDEGIILQGTSQGKTYRLLPNYYITIPEIKSFMTKLELVVKNIS